MSLRFPCLPTFFVSAVFSLTQLNGSEQKVKALGGRLFHKKGEVVEVVLNGAGLKPGGLKFLAGFRQLTDYSECRGCDISYIRLAIEFLESTKFVGTSGRPGKWRFEEERTMMGSDT